MAREMECSFGKTSIGKETISIPIKFKLSTFEGLNEAADLFNSRRFDATIVVDPCSDKDASGQETLVDTTEEVVVIAETASVGIRGDTVKTTMNIMLTGLNVEQMSHFAQRSGRITISNTQVIEPKKKSNDDDEDEDDDTPEADA